MTALKCIWTTSILCAGALVCANPIGAHPVIEGPLQAPAERSHCLAVAHRFNSLNIGFGEKITQFNQVFTSPDEDQKQILASITKLAASTRQIADALNSVYGDSPPPSAIEEASVAKRSMQELVPDVKTCLG